MTAAEFIVGAAWFTGLMSASCMVWHESRGEAGFPGLLVAVLWPLWLPPLAAWRSLTGRSFPWSPK